MGIFLKMNKQGFSCSKKRIIFFTTPWFLVLQICMLFAHDPNYQLITVEDGLPSSTVYHIFQDSKGHIWFATDMGVARFDAYEFEIFDLQDGLTDNCVFEIFEDYRGRIWFVPLNMMLSYYHDGKIKQYRYNNKIKGIQGIDKRLYQKSTFYLDSLDNLYFGIKNLGLIKIDTSGNLSNLNHESTNSLEYFTIDSKPFLIFKSLGNENHKDLLCYHQDDTLYYNLSDTPQKASWRAFSLKMDKKSILYFGKTLFQMRGFHLEESRSINSEIIWMSKDDENNLWLGSMNGCYRYRNCHIGSEHHKYLKDKSVSSVLKDHEGGYWFSTLHHGVYYSRNLDVMIHNTKHGLITDQVEQVVSDSSNTIWIGYNKPYVAMLEKPGKISNITIQRDQMINQGISDLSYDKAKDGLWIARGEGLYFYDIKLAKIRSKPFYPSVLGNVKCVFSEDHTLWFGLAQQYVKTDKEKVVYQSCLDDQYCRRVEALYKLGDTIYIGTLGGLWRYHNNRYTHLGKNDPLLYHRITAIDTYKDNLILGTRGAGILIKQHSGVIQITRKNGLISNSITALDQSKDYLWVATNRGLSRLALNSIKEADYQIFNIDSRKGLPTSELNDICISDESVYLATKKGLVSFKVDQVKPNPVAPEVNITEIAINEKDTLVRSTYDLSSQQNYITIHYHAVSYKQAGNIRYRYKMQGLDSTWNISKSPSKTFVTLPPGRYKFMVSASNEDNIWNENPGSVIFNIKKPFTATRGFYVMLILIIIAMVWAVFYIYGKISKRKKQLQRDINAYKQKMLRQQMNPHFIFNTLNSIQYFLLDDDTTSSLIYLTKFSKLMRIILDNSQYTFIPVEEEIRGLRLYLELESLRFESLFAFEIKIDESVNALEYKIPALMIQPYVENSIRHGLLHKKGAGYLLVQLKKREKSIHCIIEDNGIGRAKAEAIKIGKNYIKSSLGSKITSERIEILNSLYGEEIDVRYKDFYDDKGNPNGTRVEVFLPFIL